MQTKDLQGAIESFLLPDLLLSLQASSRTGRLRLEREGIFRDLFLRSGHVIAADSSSQDDAIEWLLLGAGRLTEERLAEVRSLIDGGMRRGRALVESGTLSPAGLCSFTEFRARYLAGDALAWTSGRYAYEDGVTPPDGSIPVRISPAEVVLAALREGPLSAALTALMPAPAQLLEHSASSLPGLLFKELLQPHEVYVLGLVDGRRRVSEICFVSEIGEPDTLRVLALLTIAGCVRDVGAGATAPQRRSSSDPIAYLPDLPPPSDLPVGETSAELRATIRIYNDMYAFVFAHMIKEVGPIAEQLLEKHLRDVRDAHVALLQRAVSGRDGSLPEDTLIRNLNMLKDQNRREHLVTALHDYLRAMVLAVRRILGPAHEGHVVRRLRELRCTRT